MNKYIQEFLIYLSDIKNYSELTINSYKDDIEDFEQFLTKNNIDSILNIRRNICRNYLLILNSSYKETSVLRKISALKSFYNYLNEHYNVENNFNTLSLPKKDKTLPKFLYIPEIESILDSIKTDNPLGIRDKCIVETLYGTACRVSELVNINIDDIDYVEKTIKLHGKGKKDRIVPIHNKLVEAIIDYIKNARDLLLVKSDNLDNKKLFINYKGTTLTTRGVRKILDKIMDNTAMFKRISPHMFRHSIATHLLDNNTDLRIVQELLGHESISSTQIYTHVSNEKLKELYMNAHPRSKKKK